MNQASAHTPTPVPVAPLLPGQVLDQKYKVGQPLGSGAMGVVYEAHHLLLQKPVAVKVLRPELAAVDEVRERFEAEARAAAAIGHPNIISVTDMGRTPDGALYFVMDRLHGETLGARLERAGRMPAALVVATTTELLSGLAAAHALGLIHRDIKPDNIFFAQSPGGRETPRILDFGVAKALSAVGKRNTGTRAGFTVGTPQYMAPEQAAGAADVDGRVDVYAMGVVAYHMLAGKPPFDGDDVMQVLTAVVSGAAPPLGKLCPEAPPELVRLVELAMHKDRNRRPASAAEFATRLQAAMKAPAPRPRPAQAAAGPVAAAQPLPAKDATFQEASALKALNAPVLVDLAEDPRKAKKVRSAAAVAPTAAVETLELNRPPPPAAVGPQRAPEPTRRDLAPPAADFEDPAPKKRKIAWWVILVPVLALAAFLVVPRLIGGAATGAGTVEELTPEAPVIVTFDVTPFTEELYVDGTKVPAVAKLSRGRHRLVVKKAGYRTKEVELMIERTTEIPIELEMLAEELPPRTPTPR